MSLSNEETRDIKKDFDDIDNKFDDARAANWGLNMCTQSVLLKVGLINKSLMGVHALYRNICHIQQYSTAKHLV